MSDEHLTDGWEPDLPVAAAAMHNAATLLLRPPGSPAAAAGRPAR